jgi:hypothetical protein
MTRLRRRTRTVVWPKQKPPTARGGELRLRVASLKQPLVAAPAPHHEPTRAPPGEAAQAPQRERAHALLGEGAMGERASLPWTSGVRRVAVEEGRGSAVGTGQSSGL